MNKSYFHIWLTMKVLIQVILIDSRTSKLIQIIILSWKICVIWLNDRFPKNTPIDHEFNEVHSNLSIISGEVSAEKSKYCWSTGIQYQIKTASVFQFQIHKKTLKKLTSNWNLWNKTYSYLQSYAKCWNSNASFDKNYSK